DWKDLIVLEYAKKKFSNDLVEEVIVDEMYKIVNGHILYKGRVNLDPNSEVKNLILKAAHDTPLSVHQGYFKTYKM
ncbi:hypothetical protein KI387_036419, partial [Taxus chinensis]